jgi:hypothetical protein
MSCDRLIGKRGLGLIRTGTEESHIHPRVPFGHYPFALSRASLRLGGEISLVAFAMARRRRRRRPFTDSAADVTSTTSFETSLSPCSSLLPAFHTVYLTCYLALIDKMSDSEPISGPSQDSVTEPSPDSLGSRLANAIPAFLRIVANVTGGKNDPEHVDDASPSSGLLDAPTLTDDDYRGIIDTVFSGTGIKLYESDILSLINTGKTAVEEYTKRGSKRGKNQLPSKADLESAAREAIDGRFGEMESYSYSTSTSTSAVTRTSTV